MGQLIVRNHSFSKMFLSYMVFFFHVHENNLPGFSKKGKTPPPPSPLNPPSNIIQKDIGVIKTSAEIPNVPPPLSPSLDPRENIQGEGYISAGVFSMFYFSHTAVRKGGGSWSLTIDQFSLIECLRSFRKNALLTYSVCTHLLS